VVVNVTLKVVVGGAKDSAEAGIEFGREGVLLAAVVAMLAHVDALVVDVGVAVAAVAAVVKVVSAGVALSESFQFIR
jgi:hypothetical protein